MSKILLIFHTIIHLRPIQIRYQVWYRVRRYWRKLTNFEYPLSITSVGNSLKFSQWIEKKNSFNNSTFTFLNITKKYPIGSIDWDETDFGKLWTYNLNYMDFLLQPEMDKNTGLSIIDKFIDTLPGNKTAIEPYTIALRGINWIKFLSKYSVLNTHYSNSLYAQYKILLNNLEYHLLGNHLLEDGFSLLFGAYYFNDDDLFKKANEIISAELKEQILEDGAHFELSAMYHQIILDRVLDCINLLQNNKRFDYQTELQILLEENANRMLVWLNKITFSNGEIPLLNDSAPNIAPTTKQLNEYVASLNLKLGTQNSELGSSGYRRFNGTNYECIIDIGQIGPSYQPGHAHADTFNFVLNIRNQSFVIDTGISTYEANKTRLTERGTAAHNTVTVSDNNSSQVWSSFRVAQSAKVKIHLDEKVKISASHNGFRKIQTTHQREFNFSDKQIEISDKLIGKVVNGKAHILISSEDKPTKGKNIIQFINAQIIFNNHTEIDIIKTKTPKGYNLFSDNYRIEIDFKENLKTTITIL